MTHFHLLIDGKLVPGDHTMPVLNPATEEVLAHCPRASKRQLNAAVAAAKAAFPAWAATPIAERRKLVEKMADLIEVNSIELAHLLTSEQGMQMRPLRLWAWQDFSVISPRSTCPCELLRIPPNAASKRIAARSV